MLPSISAWYQWHQPSYTASSDNHHTHNVNEIGETNPGISINSVDNLSHLSLYGLNNPIEPEVTLNNMNTLSSLADIALGSGAIPSSPVAPMSSFVSRKTSHQMFDSPLISSSTSRSSSFSSFAPLATYLNTSAHPSTNHIHKHCASKNAPSGRPKMRFSPLKTLTSFRHSQPIYVPNIEKKFVKSCHICSATQTPKWRSLIKGSIRIRLCNACGIRENKKKYSVKSNHQIQNKDRIRYLTLQKNSPFYTLHVS